jgi:chromosome segregation ATPase
MSDNDPLAELARLREEQRKALSEDIKEVKSTLHAMERDIHSIKQQHATTVSVSALSDRVSQLENDKAKIIGGFIGLASLQGVIGFILWVAKSGAPTP